MIINRNVYYLNHPDKPGKLEPCFPIYGTMLGQYTRNRANEGPIFLVCRDVNYCKN